MKEKNILDIPIPYVVKDKVLAAPGKWKGIKYSKSSIKKAFQNTDWNSEQVKSYFLDHDDEKTSKWIGKVDNIRFNEDTGELLGDIYIYDLVEAVKYKYAKPDFGVSPKVVGRVQNDEYTDFVFVNFSQVTEPAMKLTYYANDDLGGEKLQEEINILREWDTKYINDLPDSSFAVIEKDYLEGKIKDKNARHLPYKDANGNVDIPHLRNALARVNQIKPITSESKEELIKRALEVLEPVAKKYLETYKEKNSERGDIVEEEKMKKEQEKMEKEENKVETVDSNKQIIELLSKILDKLDSLKTIEKEEMNSEDTNNKSEEEKEVQKEEKEELKETKKEESECKEEPKEDTKEEEESKPKEEVKENSEVDAKISKMKSIKQEIKKDVEVVKENKDEENMYGVKNQNTDKFMLNFLKENFL